MGHGLLRGGYRLSTRIIRMLYLGALRPSWLFLHAGKKILLWGVSSKTILAMRKSLLNHCWPGHFEAMIVTSKPGWVAKKWVSFPNRLNGGLAQLLKWCQSGCRKASKGGWSGWGSIALYLGVYLLLELAKRSIVCSWNIRFSAWNNLGLSIQSLLLKLRLRWSATTFYTPGIHFAWSIIWFANSVFASWRTIGKNDAFVVRNFVNMLHTV